MPSPSGARTSKTGAKENRPARDRGRPYYPEFPRKNRVQTDRGERSVAQHRFPAKIGRKSAGCATRRRRCLKNPRISWIRSLRNIVTAVACRAAAGSDRQKSKPG
jgi:hypothetical protein